jgi:hypothetical protein
MSWQEGTPVHQVGFSDGCVFLAACAAGDRGEVKVLLGRGADIDTANVDGLTALHQVQKAVLRIHDILVRIRIRGYVPLKSGTGFGSGSCYFRR